MMKKNRLLLTTIFSLFYLLSTGQIEKDSLILEQSFMSIVGSPSKEDSLVRALKNKIDFKNDTLADYFDFVRTKFLFRTGQMDRALETTEARIKNAHNIERNDAKYYNLRGAIYSLQNKSNEAISEFIEASRKYEKQGNSLRAALIKNNIANIYFGLNRQEKAYGYLIACFDVLKDYPENEYYPRILGTLSISAALTNRFIEAREYADKGLVIAHKNNDSVALAILNYAKGELALNEKDFDRATSYLKISISIAQQFNLDQYRLLAQILLMKTYNELEIYDEAIKVGENSFLTAQKLPNKTTFIAIHRGLQYAYSQLYNYEKAFYHLKELELLKDISRNEKIESKSDSLLIAFESEKKDLAIKMKDLELVQADEKDKNQQLFVAVLLLLLIALLGFILLYVRVKQIQLLKIGLKKEKDILSASIEGEKNERERISSELHDGISSELTALKIKLSNENISQETILKIAELQNDVRRMAHSLSPSRLEALGLNNALAEHCKQLNSENTKIHFNSNLENYKQEMNETHVNILYRTVQELIQNALKHASAKNIDVQIIYNAEIEKINITIEDDRKGFDMKETMVNRNGTNRIKAIGGDIEYESHLEIGTTVIISVNTKEIEKK